MDKFVIRTKRKSPTPPLSEDDPIEKREKKPEKTTAKKPEKKQKKPKKEENEESKIKKMLKSTNETVPGCSILSKLLPKIKREENKAMSDEDLERLFFALCGDTGKQYDSDDSIISDIDHMDAEEIAAKDKAFRDVIESLDHLPKEIESLMQIGKIGKETEAEKEERRRVIREMKNRFKTEEEKEKDEKKRISKQKRLEKRLNSVVEVFKTDAQKVSEDVDSPSLMTCRQFCECLEIMAEVVPKDKLNEDGSTDIRGTIKQIDSKDLEKKLNFHGIKGSFYREDKPLGEYLKKKVRKLFVDPDILDVVDGDRYAFDFTTKDCLLALETYYRTNNAPDKGNGDHLSIKIREFVTSCYYVARNQNKDFVINDKLKFAMFG